MLCYLKFQEFTDTEGNVVQIKDIPRSAPNSFAKEFLKRTRGEDYIKYHVFESTSATSDRRPAAQEVIDQIKGKIILQFDFLFKKFLRIAVI